MKGENESSSSIEDKYIKHIGSKFMDTDDNILFEITDVVEGANENTLYFQYHEVNEEEGNNLKSKKRRRAAPDQCEYTPCAEILNASWVAWTEISL